MEAVAAGHICLDLTPGFASQSGKNISEILSPGKLTKVSGIALSTGGAVANTGMALSVLGIDTQLMGKIGDDYFGGIILRILKENNTEIAMTVLEGTKTSYTVILAPPGTDRIFLHDPGANDTFCSADINYGIVGAVRLFHFGYPPVMKRMYENGGTELVEIFKKVKSLGVTTSLDMAVPDPSSEAGKVDWKSLLTKLLPWVDIFVPSIEEILFMLEPEEYARLNKMRGNGDLIKVLDMNILQKLGDTLLAMGVRIVMLKCGKKGIYIRTAKAADLAAMGRALPADMEDWSGRELIEETFFVPEVLSTTGAGDTSIAGFLSCLLKNFPLEEAIKIACATGSECVQTYDALSGIKTLEETRVLLAKGWEKERIEISGSYWQYKENLAVWFGRQDTKFSTNV